MSMSYKRFAAMIATSTVVMFLLIYLNTYALEHALFSETRLSMAILMGAAMAVVMLGFMFAMYPSKRANAGIFAGGAAGRGDLYEIEASELAVDRSDSPLFARSPTRCSPTMKMPSRFIPAMPRLANSQDRKSTSLNSSH